MSCAETRHGLGAYVLGALDPAERGAVEAHLDTCPACRDELAQLAGLPGLLAHLTAEEVLAGPPEPSAGLLDRMLGELAERRAREGRRRRVLAVAAAVAVLAGGTAAGLSLTGGDHAPASTVAALRAEDPRTHVAVTAWLKPTAWGTQVRVQLSGVPADAHCRLVAVADDGHREQAGSWEATYEGTAEVTGAVSVGPADLSRLDVVTFSGDRLVSLRVPATTWPAQGDQQGGEQGGGQQPTVSWNVESGGGRSVG